MPYSNISKVTVNCMLLGFLIAFSIKTFEAINTENNIQENNQQPHFARQENKKIFLENNSLVNFCKLIIFNPNNTYNISFDSQILCNNYYILNVFFLILLAGLLNFKRRILIGIL